jgi:sulfide:quinone oxidoreductase
MTTDSAQSAPSEVLIAGGGVAALEAMLALRDLAGDRVRLTLLAPNSEFIYRPMTVREPFSYGVAQRFPLERILADARAERIDGVLASVDPGSQSVRTTSGEEHRYASLVVALGATIKSRYEHAITIDDRRIDELLHGLIQDVEDGYVKRLAVVIPPQMGWPFPAYELALMTAARAEDSNIEMEVTIVTPEDAPLALFGDGASRAVRELLEARRINVITSAYCEIPRTGQIEICPGDRSLEVDRVIALPELVGPGLPGVPGDENGFIPVDEHCRIRGLEHEYAAGDAINFAVKHGGLASQQADTVARAIAHDLGAPVPATPFEPVVRGILLTGDEPKYLSAEIMGGRGFTSSISDQPQWQPPTKIAAQYLAPYLEQRSQAV